MFILNPNDYDKVIIPASDSAAATENEVSEEPIQVEKIKLEVEEVDVEDSGKDWVHSLKLSHKETILDPRGWICSDVVNQLNFYKLLLISFLILMVFK